MRAFACTLVLLGSIVGALGCATRPFERIEPPEVHLADISPAETTAFEQRVRLTLRMINPNNVDLSFEGLHFEMALNGEPFTRGVSNQSYTLPRLGEGTLVVTTTTTLLDVLRQAGALSRNPQASFPYVLRGRIFLTDPVRREVDFERGGQLGPAAKQP